MARMQRVGVLMSTKLRQAIDKYRSLTGESRSGYIREALYQRVSKLKSKNK